MALKAVFARRFLDKFGKLIERLLKLPPGTGPRNSFTDHKKFFIEHSDINPKYSQLLKDETNWYEQDLLVWRDKILIHGKTLNTACLLSPTRGMIFIKSSGIFEELQQTYI